MGLADIFSTIFPTAYAEEEQQQQPEEVVEQVEEVVEEAEEEEEEPEEAEDPKPQIMEGTYIRGHIQSSSIANRLHIRPFVLCNCLCLFRRTRHWHSIVVLVECEKECPSLKKHLDECNERVENGSHENCTFISRTAMPRKEKTNSDHYYTGIEEFFHYMHCADECVSVQQTRVFFIIASASKQCCFVGCSQDLCCNQINSFSITFRSRL